MTSSNKTLGRRWSGRKAKKEKLNPKDRRKLREIGPYLWEFLIKCISNPQVHSCRYVVLVDILLLFSILTQKRFFYNDL